MFRPFAPSPGNKIHDWQLRADVVGQTYEHHHHKETGIIGNCIFQKEINSNKV